MYTRRAELLSAALLLAPFFVIYGVVFFYPTYDMVQLSLQDAPLIGDGAWVGFDNYLKLVSDRLFRSSLWNTVYFVILTAIPSTIIALLLAMAVERLKGWLQTVILACFFLPFMLPSSVVYLVWQWIFETQLGPAQYVIAFFTGSRVPVFRNLNWFMPTVAFITMWATVGFSMLLYLAGLRNIPAELFEAAKLDGANRWHQFRYVTWPLVWPVTVLVLTIQLIAHLKVFDQIYLFSTGGRVEATMPLVQYIFMLAFQRNEGGYAATIAVALFVIIVAFSVLQFQLLRTRGSR